MRQFLLITAFAVTMALAATNAPAVLADTGSGAAEEAVAAGADLRAPDQQAPGAAAPTVDLRAPDQQVSVSSAAPPAPAVPVDTSDGPSVLVYILLGVAAAMLFLAGGFLAARMRHRAEAVGDDLVPE